MIPYVDRDLIRTFLITFGVMILFSQIGIFIYTLLNQYRYAFAGEESKLGWVLLYFVFSMPRQMVYTFPVATAVSVLWTYTVKARQNEILAYYVGGVSPVRLATPLLIISFFLGSLSYLMTELLATRGDRAAERIERIHIEERPLETVTRERNVFQKGQGSRFYNVESFNPSEQQMDIVSVVHMNEDWTGPLWQLEARYVEGLVIDGQQQWAFIDAAYREFDEDGKVTAYREAPRILGNEVTPPIERELDRYIRQRFRPDQMNFFELREYIGLFKLQNRRDFRLETILHFNFAVPLGCFVLALLMAGHILRPRATGVVIGFGGGLLFMTAYFVLLIFSREFAGEGTIHPWLGAYGPNVIFAGVGLFLLSRNRAV